MLSFKSKLSSDIINVKHLYKKFAEACSFRSIKDTKPRKRRNVETGLEMRMEERNKQPLGFPPKVSRREVAFTGAC